MLADLELVRVFQNRLERAQHRVAIQLLRHADVGMGQRDVGRFVGLHRERQAHQLRLLRIDAGGFGVEGNQLGVVQFFQPGIEPRLIEDGFVGGFSSGGRCFGLWFAEQIGGRCRLGGSAQFQAFGVAIKVVRASS